MMQGDQSRLPPPRGGRKGRPAFNPKMADAPRRVQAQRYSGLADADASRFPGGAAALAGRSHFAKPFHAGG